MDYIEFKNKLQNLPLIFSKDLVRIEGKFQAMRNQLNRWQRRGLLLQLKRGVYILNENDRKVNPSRNFIANQLYGPSYVSLEYALNFYGLIPERVADLTSITTKKTMRFKNAIGSFIYQHIKPQAFRGFRTFKDESGLTCFIAEPEKAVVDFLYLNLKKIQLDKDGLFEESFRFQNVEELKLKKVIEFAGLFHNQKLMQLSKDFCKFIKKEGKR